MHGARAGTDGDAELRSILPSRMILRTAVLATMSLLSGINLHGWQESIAGKRRRKRVGKLAGDLALLIWRKRSKIRSTSCGASLVN